MLALYLHIPFCQSKCHYCAFNSRPLPAGGEGAALLHGYLEALRRELQLTAQNQTSDSSRQSSGKKGIGSANASQRLTAAGARPAKAGTPARLPASEQGRLSSIYFGGGTPTILDASYLNSLLALSKSFFQWDDSIEITVEANPATVTRAGLAELRQAGVNRLSLGAQSFRPSELQLLGRIHGASDIDAACRDARAAGFTNLNLDLIYGLPGQTPDGWRENLQRALDLGLEHLSAYGLKLEVGTPLAEDVAAGKLPECGEDQQVEMWYETQRLVSAAGLERYEISNYARPGRESRHNLAYWLNLSYLGLGAGASGHVPAMRAQESVVSSPESGARRRNWRNQSQPESDGRPTTDDQMVRYTNHEDAARYIASVERGELPRAWKELQTSEQERADTVMMGLRLTGGLERKAFEERFGDPFEFFYGSQLDLMERDGLMGESAESVFLTERGLLLSNYVLAHFI
jgi:oxygen-independent coproporphyrinogen-3 oxidase